MRPDMTKSREAGTALAGAMLVTLLMAAVMVSVASIVSTDVQTRRADGARTQSFYAAQAGLEKLTADLGNLFSVNVAPTGAAINALTVLSPTLSDVAWRRPDGASGYRVTFPADGSGNPTALAQMVQAGPFQGLVGLSTQYQMDVTAQLTDGAETNLTRTLQTVSIPVFQFGMFSENDLSFFAGPVFNFGGRVHTNSDLYLASGATLTGTAANELLLGRNTATTLDAGGGNDCLVGGAGADLNMRGRAGTDVCIGNGGADTFNADCETQIQ